MEPLVDIIIPVFGGAAETRACIESVLRWPQRTPHQIIVIDDASPHADVRAYLDTLASNDRIELIRQQENLGFVATANVGMWLHRDRDVVLLNSDTEVANDWLDRLRACAAAHPYTATVTPFSNNATICSYPRIGENNALPAELDTAALDDLFRRHNQGAVVDLPTGVGFCLYLTRLGIEALGGFDEDTFGAGYGEEVDYCLRGSIAGWRNLLCANVFVRHKGGVSFQASGAARREAAQHLIDNRFPDYPQLVSGFFQRDPPRRYRRTVDLARLCGSARPRLLFISHAWGGGVARHVHQLADALAGTAEILLLQPERDGAAALRWICPGEELTIFLPFIMDSVQSWCKPLAGLGLSRLHYHHVQGFPPSVLDLPEALRLPYDVTLHDYWPVCPQLYFFGADGRYCGEPEDIAVCRRCISDRPPAWQLDIETWRRRCLDWLAGADRVIAPSADVAQRIGRYRAGLPLVTWPHPEPAVATSFPLARHSLVRRKVLLLGSLSDAKGLDLVSAAASYAAQERVPVDFRVIGSVRRLVPTWPEANISIYGEYAEADLPAILERERPDAFLFGSLIPETFSYTLSIAMRTGLPIAALDIGAIGERLRGYTHAVLMPVDIDAPELVAQLAALPPAYLPSATAALAPSPSPGLPLHDYLKRYLEPVLAKGPVEPPQLDARQLYPVGLAAVDAPPVETLYEHGVLCGMAEARAQLERELRHVDDLKRQLTASAKQNIELNKQSRATAQELAALSRSMKIKERAHRRDLRQLKAKTKRLQSRINALEQSTFWRMSAPIRWAVHTGRTGLVSLRRLPARMTNDAPPPRRLLAASDRPDLARLAPQVPQAHARAVSQIVPEVYRIDVDLQPLRVPVSTQPEVSIIMPTYGQHELGYTCLKSLTEHPTAVAYEVLLIDDHAPHPAAEALTGIEGVTILRNSENLGFLRSCNRAAKQARGRFLLFLNNDTIVLDGCIDALHQTFADHPGTGAVGARLIDPDGRLQEAGGIVWRDGSAWNWGRGADLDDPRFTYVRETDYCSAACLMVPAALFQALGGFDERYAPAYYEDTDLCLALRDHGHRVLYQPAATVVHFEGASHGTDETTGLKAFQVRNRHIFREKWAARLARHRDNGVCPERERDRLDGPRVLWIEACMLTPDQDSGSLRTWRLLGLLQELGCKVTFMADNLEAPEPYAEQLRQRGIEVQCAPQTESVADYLVLTGANHDIIVLCRHYVAIKYADLVRKVAPDALLVFDTIDLHYLRLRRQAGLDGSDKTRKLAQVAYQEELRICAHADITLVVSRVEAEELRAQLPGARVEVVSNVEDPIDDVPPPAGRDGIIFVGGFQHPPNIDAVEYFAAEIWPLFRKAHPGVPAYIIGSRMPDALRAGGEAAGLRMLGYVEDLTPYYRGCRLAIAPLRYGAGVKGKINQSLAQGLPMVATPLSVEGMMLNAHEDIMLAATPAEFAAAMVAVYQDDVLWSRLSEGGRERIREQFSTPVALKGLSRILAGASSTYRPVSRSRC